jgi:hypothetical protein
MIKEGFVKGYRICFCLYMSLVRWNLILSMSGHGGDGQNMVDEDRILF